jgi:hypothetical protein
MNRSSTRNARSRSGQAVVLFGALGLAASPAALAKDRGGPGQPGTQTAFSNGFTLLTRRFDLRRLVAWSD